MPRNVTAILGLAITVLSIVAGAAMAWQRLADRVDMLERRERFEHGSYALPLQESERR